MYPDQFPAGLGYPSQRRDSLRARDGLPLLTCRPGAHTGRCERARARVVFGVRRHDRAWGLDDMSSSPKAASCRRTPNWDAAPPGWFFYFD